MADQPTDDKNRRDAAPAPGREAPPAAPREAPPAFPVKGPVRVGRDAPPRQRAGDAAPDAAAKAPAEAAPAAKVAAEAGPAAKAAADEAGAPDRGELRRQWKDEAQAGTSAHDKKVRRFLLRLSLLNWGIAIVAWTISAALGITSPASIIVYSVLFVIGLVAAILAILTYLAEKFGHEPAPMGPIRGAADGDAGDDAATAKGDTAAPAAT